ncbi:MAG: ACP S-malonyltransferase [Oscillospiraceae bacterium]|jgi:[acyl-carrier-protein] S-malonyltransferase|nr:ACP S-malonyltransferase [Oscillospiraceae bacterium]
MKSYLFPGQGAQTVTMASEILSEFPEAARFYDEARQMTGSDLVSVLPEQLEQTRFAQLAIVVHSVASLEKHRAGSADPETAAMAGFSLGEYTALYAAGVISYSDLLRLVNERARLMQEATQTSPGAMFAIIGLADEKVEETIALYDEVYAVNYNCPGQLVIAGAIEQTESAADRLLAAGARRAHRLSVNGAFHTPLMSQAAEALERFAEGIVFGSPKAPLYSNTTAARVPEDVDFPKYLARHMISPVRFTEEIRRLREDGYEEHVELGPGRVLTGLVKKI